MDEEERRKFCRRVLTKVEGAISRNAMPGGEVDVSRQWSGVACAATGNASTRARPTDSRPPSPVLP